MTLSRTNHWSRREDLNTPSADYGSAALPLSYTGSRVRAISGSPSRGSFGHRRGEEEFEADGGPL